MYQSVLTRHIQITTWSEQLKLIQVAVQQLSFHTSNKIFYILYNLCVIRDIYIYIIYNISWSVRGTSRDIPRNTSYLN